MNEEMELCVLCGKPSTDRRDENVEGRMSYVEGVGQLCGECYAKIYGSTEALK